MLKKPILNITTLLQFVNFIYEDAVPTVYTRYSELEKEVEVFKSANELCAHIMKERNKGETALQYAIYYPDMNGFINTRIIHIKPEVYGKNTFRYAVQGWGLIYFFCNFLDSSTVECEISVNLKKRAELWSQTGTPELKDPKLWSWPDVEKYSRRLTRYLRNHCISS